jgi:DNA polymerase-1
MAPKDRLLIEADYKGIELRVLAHVSKDPFMLDCFKRGMDLHDEMSKVIYGPNFTDEQRVAVKGVNFGIAYGRQAHSIAQEFGISDREAQMIINDWFERAKGAKEYMDKCVKQLLSKEPFVTPFGRYRRYGVITGDEPQKNEARNFSIQSIASDLTLLSAIELEGPLLNLFSFIVNIIHDSILIEAPNSKLRVYQIIDLLKEIMENTPNKWLKPEIPFPVEVKIGHSWGSLKEIDINTKQFVA